MQYLFQKEKGGNKMNEVFEMLSDIFEELRNEAGERKYSVQTEEAKNADRQLQKKNKAYEKNLLQLEPTYREFLEDNMETLEHAHFQEEQ